MHKKLHKYCVNIAWLLIGVQILLKAYCKQVSDKSTSTQTLFKECFSPKHSSNKLELCGKTARRPSTWAQEDEEEEKAAQGNKLHSCPVTECDDMYLVLNLHFILANYCITLSCLPKHAAAKPAPDEAASDDSDDENESIKLSDGADPGKVMSMPISEHTILTLVCSCMAHEPDETYLPSAKTVSTSAKTDEMVPPSAKPDPHSPQSLRSRRALPQPAQPPQRTRVRPLQFVSSPAS
jgi:hypothetical protein